MPVGAHARIACSSQGRHYSSLTKWPTNAPLRPSPTPVLGEPRVRLRIRFTYRQRPRLYPRGGGWGCVRGVRGETLGMKKSWGSGRDSRSTRSKGRRQARSRWVVTMGRARACGVVLEGVGCRVCYGGWSFGVSVSVRESECAAVICVGAASRGSNPGAGLKDSGGSWCSRAVDRWEREVSGLGWWRSGF